VRAGKLDLRFTQGDVYDLQLTFAVGGEGLDWSDFTFRAQVRPSPDAPRFWSFDVDDSASDDGVVVISLTPEQTRAMPEDCSWDFERLDGDDPVTLLAGSVRVTRDVTRTP
jgi:hypothetical protein